MIDVSQRIVSAAPDLTRMNILLDADEVGNDHFYLPGVHVPPVNHKLVHDVLKIVTRLDDVLFDAFHGQGCPLVQRVGVIGHEPLVVVGADLVHVFDVVAW